MRLWSLHPKYLDRQGLVALWREALLAQAALRGETRGYRSHPQLDRFRGQPCPQEAIGAYLAAVLAEADRRGYSFDAGKIASRGEHPPFAVTAGQLQYEWAHLMGKLAVRDPQLHRSWREAGIVTPDCHPLFRACPGGIELWERP